MDYSILQEYGIDGKQGLSRCLNDESFYARYLSMFTQDTSFARLKAAFAARDHRLMFESAHELKGVCGNVGMTELYAADNTLVEYLRGQTLDEETLTALFSQVELSYNRALCAVRMVQTH